MNAIVPFDFETKPVRISDRDGQPWFVAADVCAALDLANVGGALARLEDDERGSIRNPDATPAGGNPNLTIISESGLYALILRSRKAAAKRFRRWVTGEVLPAIRRTGGYGGPAAPLDLTDTATLHRLLLDHTGRTLAADERIAALEPKAAALDRLERAEGSLSVTHAAKQLGVRPGRLFDWLEGNGWLYRGADGLLGYQVKIDQGLIEHKSHRLERRGKPDRYVPHALLTPKGIARLAELRAGL